ncbi:pre-toxin TG domain-containing protein [Paenibacillus sp. Soil522]|uniref:pre-toxin TG domain-containing protein n=1 Tax=Paenibacillus sp. Soil522 TaxID=1736388 RepID=UPI0009D71C7B|nr:pre-toxin TG domain-containing protein [Paenibacillus sp. Soil522]
MKHCSPFGILIGLCLFFGFPDMAFADNCGSFSDCFNTQRAAVSATVGLGIFATLLSIGLNFVPVVGQVKGVIEAVTGKDLITGEELETWERAMNLVPFGAIGKVGRIGDILDTSGDLGRGVRHTDDVGGLVNAGRAGRSDIPSGGLRDDIGGSGSRRSPNETPERSPGSDPASSGAGGGSKPPRDQGGGSGSRGDDGDGPGNPRDEGRSGKPHEGEGNNSDEGTGQGSKGNIDVGKADLDAYRNKLGVPETDTVAVGKTDVKGLEDLTFTGGSPKVRKEAGLPDLDSAMPDRPIKSPSSHPLSTRHAEEGVINEFVEQVEKKGLKPEEVVGTLNIHQSNPKGVCTTCIQGISNPNVEPGIFMQLSLKNPNLTINVTTEIVEGVKPAGKLSFTLQNGKIID